MHRKTVFTLVAVCFLLLVGTIQAQDVTVVTWWTEDYVDVETLNELLVEPFNAANPGIRLEIIPQTALDEAVRTAFAAGGAPDILQTPGAAFIGEFVRAGLIHPLTSAAADLNWEDKLLPWAYESGILNGELYSIPLTFETMILMYNKTLFEENGWTAPTTFEELQAIAEAAQAQGINPFGYGNQGFQPANEHVIGVYLNNYAGADNVYAAMTGEKSWTDPEFAEAIELLRSHMADENWFNDSLETWFAYGWNEQFTALATRESAMMIIGTWGFRGADEFFSEVDDEWDWAPIPPYSANMPEYNYMLATGSTLSVNGLSQNIDAAVAVLDFLFSDPALVLEIASGYSYGEFVVPLEFALEDFPEGTDERISRFYNDFAEVTGEGRVGYTTWTFWPAAADVQLWQEIENVWYGEMTVDTYLANHQAVWDEARADGAVPPVPSR